MSDIPLPGGGTLKLYDSIYTPQQIEAAIGKGPMIKDGTWWLWDVATMKYWDTGYSLAEGLGPGSVTTPMLADSSVTWPKLSQDARHSNPNLLDNWYFVGGGSQQEGGQFPINQRGQTEYTTAGYTIDRWIMLAGALTISPECITFLPNGTTILGQRVNSALNEYLVDKVVTFSVLTADNILATSTGVWPQSGSVENIVSGIKLLFGPSVIGWGQTTPGVWVNCNKSLIAAKLELGDHQTLAHQDADGNWVLNDPPPNKTVELEKCQRYQLVVRHVDDYATVGNGIVRSDGTFDLVIPTPTTMRSIPAVSITGSIIIDFIFGYKEVTSVAPYNGGSGCVNFHGAFGEPIANSGPCWAYCSQSSQVILDCNL